MIKDLKETAENIRYIFNAPTVNILVICGLVLIFLSFCSFDGLKNFTLTASPKWIMFIVGCVLTLGGVAIYVLIEKGKKKVKKVKVIDGLSVKLGGASVNLRVGKIQEISGMDETAAVVLPANTAFIDDCITDKNSALGAFMLDRYPAKIPEIGKVIGKTLETSRALKNSDGTYLPGTTIALPSPWNIPVNVLITAATIRRETTGIRAEPSSICECIRHIFMITSDKKISKIRMPILGSGHGGLEINAALLFLMLSIRHYASQYHHIKTIDIIVTENDAKRLKDIPKLQYLLFLGEVAE